MSQENRSNPIEFETENKTTLLEKVREIQRSENDDRYDVIQKMIEEANNSQEILEVFLSESLTHITRTCISRLKELESADQIVVDYLKKQERIEGKSIELIETVREYKFITQCIKDMVDLLEEGNFDVTESNILANSFKRGLELKVPYYEESYQDLARILIETDQYYASRIMPMVLAQIKDPTFLIETLSKATRESDSNIIADESSYWNPFTTVACDLAKRVDLDVVKELISDEDYRYATRLLALSRLQPGMVFPEDIKAIHDLLAVPFDEEYDDNENYINYDYGQSQMRVECIQKGLLDYYPNELVGIANEPNVDLNVAEAIFHRIEHVDGPIFCDEEMLKKIRQQGIFALDEFKMNRKKKEEAESESINRWIRETDSDDLYQ